MLQKHIVRWRNAWSCPLMTFNGYLFSRQTRPAHRLLKVVPPRIFPIIKLRVIDKDKRVPRWLHSGKGMKHTARDTETNNYKKNCVVSTVNIKRLTDFNRALQPHLPTVTHSNRILESNLSTVTHSNRTLEPNLSTVTKSNQTLESNLSTVTHSNRTLQPNLSTVDSIQPNTGTQPVHSWLIPTEHCNPTCQQLTHSNRTLQPKLSTVDSFQPNTATQTVNSWFIPTKHCTPNCRQLTLKSKRLSIPMLTLTICLPDHTCYWKSTPVNFIHWQVGGSC